MHRCPVSIVVVAECMKVHNMYRTKDLSEPIPALKVHRGAADAAYAMMREVGEKCSGMHHSDIQGVSFLHRTLPLIFVTTVIH